MAVSDSLPPFANPDEGTLIAMDSSVEFVAFKVMLAEIPEVGSMAVMCTLVAAESACTRPWVPGAFETLMLEPFELVQLAREE